MGGPSSGGPGHGAAQVVSNFTRAQFRTVLGADLLSLVEAAVPSPDQPDALCRAALWRLRSSPESVLPKGNLRDLLLDATPVEKLAELAQRVRVSSSDVLRRLPVEHDSEIWSLLLGFYGLDMPAALLTPGLGVEHLEPEFGLFPHQRRIARQAYETLRDGHGRVVLHMPTGTGKTRTTMQVVSRILEDAEPCLVVWLASSSELLEQAADAFRTSWAGQGSRPLRVARFWGHYSPSLSDIADGLLVAGFQKAHAVNNRSSMDILRLGARTRLVVVDEAHQAIAPTYRNLIASLADTGPCTAVMGLTATPGRTWADVDADRQLSVFFGERKITVEIDGYDDPVVGLVEQGYMARPTFSRLRVEASPDLKRVFEHGSSGDDYDESVLEAVAADLDRNLAIIREIRRLASEGHTRIMFFGASVPHAEGIAAALAAVSIDAHFISAGTGTSARRRIVRAFRTRSAKPMVLCNYGVLTAGFDAPSTSACVIARPTKSLVLYSQMVGRATRGPHAGGNAACAISTVVDVDLPGFGDLTEAFSNWEDVWT